MKFLSEMYDIGAVQVLEEDMDGQKNVYIEGVFMQGSVVNGNKRVYPVDILKEATEKYVETHVRNNRAVGELGHPDNPNINLDRISHLIEDLKMIGSNVNGRAKLAETPCGGIAKGLVKTGVKLGVSSRGLGSMISDPANGHNTVQKDFMIITAADIVFDPSAPDAFVSGLMENQDWVFNSATQEWEKRGLEYMQESLHQSRNNYDHVLSLVNNYLDNL